MTGHRTFTLVLGGDASIKQAQNVASQLRQAIDSHTSIGIDTQTLSAADLTTVQTLLAARAKARAQDKTLLMLAPIAEPLQAVLEAAGFLAAGDAAFWSPSSDQPRGPTS